MNRILLILIICLSFSSKKDLDKKLSSKNWRIESITVTPAMTIGSKISTNYLDLSGPSSCEATTTLIFSADGIFTQSANGALCDLFQLPNSKPVTWTREGNQILISSAPQFPYTLSGNKLTQTKTSVASGGTVYTFEYVYSSK
ncbi:MAG: hypothetical protein EOO96_11530 [Pedobacter sp.]|nr:MAG: hypothetical protein EOO96_11530 [Pedobacter sp.]